MLKLSPESTAERSPLADAKRSVYYDHSVAPYYTEWHLLEEGEVRAGNARPVAVAGIRPGGIGEAIARMTWSAVITTRTRASNPPK